MTTTKNAFGLTLADFHRALFDREALSVGEIVRIALDRNDEQLERGCARKHSWNYLSRNHCPRDFVHEYCKGPGCWCSNRLNQRSATWHTGQELFVCWQPYTDATGEDLPRWVTSRGVV